MVESTSARELGWRTATLTGARSARGDTLGLGGWATGKANRTRMTKEFCDEAGTEVLRAVTELFLNLR
jgi:hypothetical protein